MLLLYLRDFGSNTCSAVSYNGIANHLSFSNVTATNTGIESRMCMNGGTINISPIGYRNLFNTKQMSISLWLNANTAGIFSGNENTSGVNNRGYSLFLYPSVNDLHLSWQNDSNNTVCAPVIYGVIKSGDWNHICIVNNNGNVKVYVNGAKVHEENMSTWTKNWSAADSAQLLKCQSGNYIDAVRFYNHALSEEEVLNLYKNPFVIINNSYNMISDCELPIQSKNITELYIGLPEAYQQVNYIQASGAQQINTGVYFNPQTDSMECMYQATNASHNGMIVANSNTTNHFWFYHYYDSGKIDVYISNSTSQYGINSVAVDTNIHTSTYKNKTFSTDGTSYGTHSQTFTTTETPLYICSWGGGYYYQGRIYSCKLWKSGQLVRNFVPCYRKSDNKPGLYDVVNNIFYTNSGSGDFTIGTNMPACPVGTMPMYFNGTNSYIAIPYTNNFKVDKLLTINIWAYKDNWGEFSSRGERLYSCTEAGGWDLWSTSGIMQTELHTGSYSTCNGPACSSIPSGWHMFTQTYNYLTKSHKFYIDGVLQSSATASSTYIVYNTSNYILIGAEAGPNTSPNGCYFRGMIADFRMIAGELTAKEVANLYYGTGVKMLNNYAINAGFCGLNLLNTNQVIKKHGLSCKATISNACPVRYIKDTLIGGSTANTDNHWNGIRVYSDNGSNLSSSATSKLNGSADSTQGLLRDSYDANNWGKTNMSGSGTTYHLIDLGGIKDVNRIEVHHYGEDSRTYSQHKLEISEDGINWITVHDSTIHGTYTERPISNGVMTFYPVINKIIFKPGGKVLAKNFIK